MPRFWKRKFKKGEFNQEYFQYIDTIVKEKLGVNISTKGYRKTLLYLVCEKISKLSSKEADSTYLETLRSHVITLLENGANPNHKDVFSDPIIFIFLRNLIFYRNRRSENYLQFQLDIVKLLIEYGGRLNVKVHENSSLTDPNDARCHRPKRNMIDILIDTVSRIPSGISREEDELFSRIFTFLLDEGAVIESSSPHPQLKRRDLPRCFSILYDYAKEEPNEEQIRIILS